MWLYRPAAAIAAAAALAASRAASALAAAAFSAAALAAAALEAAAQAARAVKRAECAEDAGVPGGSGSMKELAPPKVPPPPAAPNIPPKGSPPPEPLPPPKSPRRASRSKQAPTTSLTKALALSMASASERCVSARSESIGVMQSWGFDCRGRPEDGRRLLKTGGQSLSTAAAAYWLPSPSMTASSCVRSLLRSADLRLWPPLVALSASSRS
mmetsp:Transcript_160131/g.513779  ORF Transcript_160131/g.513779 Transcript_160131/m.513779 type:complete len:212 (-) Transcript_160131:176-811(-)